MDIQAQATGGSIPGVVFLKKLNFAQFEVTTVNCETSSIRLWWFGFSARFYRVLL